ncbi:MAG: hypothetical protein A2W21_00265 [Betaproteobacteria bacterium RBG_16_66_20]|nr:MAG: hypothetical protein A2W21_00265 [Betaproteobacteria bacterium RBG_16_66_20]
MLAAIAMLALGLWADIHVDLPGQLAIGAVVWALLLCLIAPLPRAERRIYLACVAIATAGEMFLSLGWGLYTYRLGNVPMFVPPGHALMLMLGLSLARRMPEIGARSILGGAGAYTLLAAITGLDTLAVPLYLMLAVSVLSLPAQRRLFASSFVLTLTLELYGTTLGNWYWHREVPWVGLATTNPPAIAGAFYCTLHALVIAAAALFSTPRLAPTTR